MTDRESERATPEVRIHLAGQLGIELDGRPVANELPGRQGRLLLAFLTLSRHRVVSRDELVEAVWGDHPAP